MNKLFKFLLIIIISFNSCDILRSSRFEVISWSPGDGYHSEPDKITVSLNFSREPDRESVERRFSLSSDTGRVNGTFRWESRKMTFSTFTPLEKNMDYNINLSAEASDTRGLSLDAAFERGFTTRPGNERPVLVSCYPAMNEAIDDQRAEVKLEFSIPVPLDTLYDNVSFNPSMTGFWRLENSGKTAVFTPADMWAQNKKYEIRFSVSLTDNNRMGARNDFLSVFTIGTDREKPLLLQAYRVMGNGEAVLLQQDLSGFIGAPLTLTENRGWEKDDRLSLVFSKPVDSLSVKNSLNIEDASGLVMESAPGYKTEFIFHFETIPAFESRFVLKLKSGVKDSAGNESENEYIYRIFADGKFSKPPALVGIRLPMAPENETDKELVCFGIDSPFEIIPIKDGNYPSTKGIKTWIELYFITAESASVDLFSLMELFRVETGNNALEFSPRRIKTENFSVTEPHPEWENFERIEIAGVLTNSVYFGIVNFQIAPGLKDTLGNRNEKLLRISLIK